MKPDLVSILIGVNDIWHGLNGRYDGTVETYENDYLKLINRTRKALPNSRLVVCEPFVLKCGAVNDKWFPEFDKYRASALKVATSNDCIFVPFQSMFDEAVKYAPPNHWAGDGVHPSSHGSSLMAHFWLNSVTISRALDHFCRFSCMKAVQLIKPKVFQHCEIDEPSKPSHGEALIRTVQMGICGTDVSCYLGKFPFFDYPRIPGHELGIEVLEVGAGVTNVKPGDRCSVEPYLNCGQCHPCKKGRGNCCENLKVFGVMMNGGLY